MRSILLFSCLLGLLAAIPASAQQTSSAPADQTTQAAAADPATPTPQATPAPDASAQAAAAAPAAAPTWSVGPIDFAGTLDGYYNFNFNHPFIGGARNNIGYNFDNEANQFSLNLAKIGMSHQPDPVGFELDLAYGNTMSGISSVNAVNSGPDGGFGEFDRVVEQAYVSLKPAKAKGFEIDFGKFNTTAGAEVIESYNDWNYSRSLLFSWAIPYDHFGIRTSWPMGKHITGGFQLVNGWNNTVDDNSGKTIGPNIMITYPKWNFMFDYYGGPENFNTNTGWRSLYDTVLNLTPSAKFAAYVNFDYGQNRNPDNTLAVWDGIAVAAHFMPNAKWSFTPRYEWFNDRNGFATDGIAGYGTASLVPNTIQEITLTGEYKIMEGLLWRAEYRYDTAAQPIFTYGQSVGSSACNELAPTVGFCPQDFGLGNHKTQSTITIAFVAFFGPKR
jgi:hypothetical protein